MDDQNYKDLAWKARDLYLLTQAMQKIMKQMFFNEFLDLDQKEENQRIQQDDLPF